MHFVYVFSREDKERMEKRGFRLIKGDDTNGIWVFENETSIALFEDLKCVVSDVLTF